MTLESVIARNKIVNIISEIEKRPWIFDDYGKQNWGIWLHRMSAYVGRIKPSFAHWIIKVSSKPDDVILDPFCGIGTVPLEADLLGRKSFGIDLNPYAVAIARAKFDRRGLDNEIEYLKALNLESIYVDLSNLPKFVKEYYHPKTLKEIIALRNQFIKDNRYFLLGCLLSIAHGHRPQHLSIRTGYIIPYIPKPKPSVEYKPAIPRMLMKVKRIYKDKFPLESNGEIIEADARNMPLDDNSVDVVISSPPYYNTLDYVTSNKLRLSLMGLDEKQQEKIQHTLIQDKKTYLAEMKKVASEIRRVLKPNSLCIFILGDLHLPKYSINTAADIAEVYSKEGFIVHGIVEDEIPSNRATIVKFGGESAIEKKKKKHDRILVLSTE
jgi:DNA modification methylase